jgi:prepilin peptidase CpaA
MQSSQVAIAIPVLVILAIAMLVDWRAHKLPNVLTFGSAFFALILQGSLNGGAGLLMAGAGWITCLLCFLPFYALRGMAAGDVKLIAAVGAFIGPGPGLAAAMFSLLAGGLISVISIAAVCGPTVFLAGNWRSDAFRLALKRRIPYAGAIAAGTSFLLLVPASVPPMFQLGA